MITDLHRLRDQLKRHEGTKRNVQNRHVVYDDSLGIPTIGYGRNCRDPGLSEGEAEILLENDITQRERALAAALPYFEELTDARKRALVNMSFMGVAKVLKFTDMLRALAAKDYGRAADEMLASKWARQVGDRAVELAAMMRTGSDPA